MNNNKLVSLSINIFNREDTETSRPSTEQTEEATKEKVEANFALSGKLAAETNTLNVCSSICLSIFIYLSIYLFICSSIFM